MVLRIYEVLESGVTYRLKGLHYSRAEYRLGTGQDYSIRKPCLGKLEEEWWLHAHALLGRLGMGINNVQ